MIEAITVEIRIALWACNSNVITEKTMWERETVNVILTHRSIGKYAHVSIYVRTCGALASIHRYVWFRAGLVEMRLISDDQIMAINSSSTMNPFACKLVPFPAEELPEFNLSPRVPGRSVSVVYAVIPTLHTHTRIHTPTHTYTLWKRMSAGIDVNAHSVARERKHVVAHIQSWDTKLLVWLVWFRDNRSLFCA